MSNLPPEAVARAVAAACREFGVPVECVLRGDRDAKNPRYPLSRARAYAAWALYVAHPSGGKLAIARAVGVAKASWECHVSNVESKRCLPWWDHGLADRIIAAIGSTDPVPPMPTLPPPPPEPEPWVPQTPARHAADARRMAFAASVATTRASVSSEYYRRVAEAVPANLKHISGRSSLPPRRATGANITSTLMGDPKPIHGRQNLSKEG